MDFRKASNHFADPDFDGVPVRVLTNRIEYLDENSKLVAESLRDYSRKMLREPYASRRRLFLFGGERLQKLVQTNQCPCMAPNWQS